MSIDLTVFALVALLGGIGLARGFLKQFWGLGIIVLLLLFRPWNLAPVMGVLESVIPGDLPGSAALRSVVGFVGLYVPLAVTGWFVERAVIRKTPLVNELDRLLGLSLGLLKGGVLAVLLLWTMETVIYKSRTVDQTPSDVLSASKAVGVVSGTNPFKLAKLRQELPDTPGSKPPPRLSGCADAGVLDEWIKRRVELGSDWPGVMAAARDPSLRRTLADPRVSRDLLAR